MNQRDYKNDSEYRAQVRAHILNFAKQLLDDKIGVIDAARELNVYWHEVEPELQSFLAVFVVINDETDVLPIGEVRQYWQPEALIREDVKIADLEKFYHDAAIENAGNIIKTIEKLLK